MAVTTAADVNYWFDRRCARAFWSQHEAPPYHELLRHTVAWLEPAAGQRWLDLGCGSGQLSRTLWQHSGGRLAGIVALDCAAADADAIAAIRASFTPPVSAEQMVFQQADFSHGLGGHADASFDGVVSGLAIQYAQHWCPEQGCWTTSAYDALLRDVCRVLRPGGRFVFSVNVPEPTWRRVAFFSIPGFFTSRRPLRFLRNSMRMMRYGAWLKREAVRGRFHYLPAATVTAKLQQAGFVRIEHRLSYARQAYVFRAFKPA